jgi:hypothetical protein
VGVRKDDVGVGEVGRGVKVLLDEGDPLLLLWRHERFAGVERGLAVVLDALLLLLLAPGLCPLALAVGRPLSLLLLVLGRQLLGRVGKRGRAESRRLDLGETRERGQDVGMQLVEKFLMNEQSAFKWSTVCDLWYPG